MSIPHFLVIPYPIMGHINPLMQFSQLVAKHGCNITFLNTEFSHKRATSSGSGQDNLKESRIKFVTLPDGLDPEDDRNDQVKVLLSIRSTMTRMFPKLIEDINALDKDNKITCIIATMNMGWALEVGHKLGIKGALLWPPSATTLAFCDFIPNLIDDGVIDSDGLPLKKQEIQLSPNMPPVDSDNLPWGTLGKVFVAQIVQEMQTFKLAEWWLCNTTYDFEPAAFSLSQRYLPIGPLVENYSYKTSFWEEDVACLEWLDQQPPQSVLYVSFGSMATLEQSQFNELALALDLLDKPFLWVVRPDNNNKVINAYPDEFHGSKGKVVKWAPQKKILNHPAIACFISHCGWNSTIEGVHASVPFLCWPFSTDQFLNKSFICDVWKIGLGLDKDENGIIPKGEIRTKVEQVIVNEDLKARSLKLKEITINNLAEGGQSSNNLKKFINWTKH
ncbi:UDP-glycosyltransferase 83A1-like [Lotus japonicus]|uniref:UDP-glycosyltransferase 83A1-like n=1 Tax=Lotus japonicus TaxID=34305 RepID=UPI0025827C23|nr:UDP-glycosyltransferase 83A1-like [Lotus japonicus]